MPKFYQRWEFQVQCYRDTPRNKGHQLALEILCQLINGKIMKTISKNPRQLLRISDDLRKVCQ